MPSLSPLSSLASHVDVLGGSSSVPAPPTSAETNSHFRFLAVFFCFKETNQHWLIVTREANHMLWRKGNRHVWFTSGGNFAITKVTKPKYPSIFGKDRVRFLIQCHRRKRPDQYRDWRAIFSSARREAFSCFPSLSTNCTNPIFARYGKRDK